ncbi:DNA-formamidopyrimidine glycosylase family protein [Microbacterium testaceum]|uniref:DNA-formamidopyrimidine glycosylase family protein n=1 Tax=Microbacterium testaceum TaxID=2033 RepID=UPI001247818B|nr:DNA-formamidopyrimidine glycosylase family protein [Microbacterium testaceum]
MPEGDTVYRAAAKLSAALAGKVVTRFDIRVPGSATADLRGETVHEVAARGKHLLHRIGGYTLHSHLKMEGRWDVYRPGERWRRPAFKARAIVGVAGADAVGFDLAMVEVLRTSDEHTVIGHLGPDLLADDWDEDEAVRRVSVDDRAAHVALLDQRNVAGFGNVYANELLFVRGIAPTTPATEIDARATIALGERMIRANLPRPERTFTGDSRPGRRFWVYGREGAPCRRCGTPIRATSLGASATSERNVYWCPTCQPG